MTKQEIAELEKRLSELESKRVQTYQAYIILNAQIQLLQEILGSKDPKAGDE